MFRPTRHTGWVIAVVTAAAAFRVIEASPHDSRQDSPGTVVAQSTQATAGTGRRPIGQRIVASNLPHRTVAPPQAAQDDGQVPHDDEPVSPRPDAPLASQSAAKPISATPPPQAALESGQVVTEVIAETEPGSADEVVVTPRVAVPEEPAPAEPAQRSFLDRIKGVFVQRPQAGGHAAPPPPAASVPPIVTKTLNAPRRIVLNTMAAVRGLSRPAFTDPSLREPVLTSPVAADEPAEADAYPDIADVPAITDVPATVDVPAPADTPATADVDEPATTDAPATAEVSAVPDGPAPQTALEPAPAPALLEFEISELPSPAGEQEQVVMQVAVRNLGGEPAECVTATLFFAEGLEPTEAIGHSAEVHPGEVRLATVPALPPGSSVDLIVKAVGTRPGSVAFRGELECSQLLDLMTCEGAVTVPSPAAPSP